MKTMQIYLIGALKNPNIPGLANALRAAGYKVYDDWWSAGEHADTEWRKHEQMRGRGYRDALYGEHARNVFEFDKGLLDASDVAVLVLPAGKSAYAEMGYMRGSGKRVIALLDEPNPERWDVMLKFAQDVVESREELLTVLGNLSTMVAQPFVSVPPGMPTISGGYKVVINRDAFFEED